MTASRLRKPRRDDNPVHCFVRRGYSLVPEMEFDIHALDGVRQGQRVRVQIEDFANLDRLRAYWAMLGEVVDATDCAPSPKALHNGLKLRLGLVDAVRVEGENVTLVPSSIALSAMPEAEREAYIAAAEEIVIREHGFVPYRERKAA